MRIAAKLALAALLVQGLIGFPLATAEPLKFTYKTIPYGTELDSVLALASGATVREDSYVTFRGPGSYHSVMAKYFSGGYYHLLGVEAHLYSKAARKFVVYAGDQNYYDETDLYFTRPYDSDQPYRLFMVERAFESPGGNYRTVFSGFRDAISEQTGLAATSYETEYAEARADGTLHLDRFPARYAVWQTDTRRVLLLVGQDMCLSSMTNSPIVLYVWRPGLRTYLNACNAQKEAEDAAEREKAKGMGKGF
jgi:hypothetical protein